MPYQTPEGAGRRLGIELNIATVDDPLPGLTPTALSCFCVAAKRAGVLKKSGEGLRVTAADALEAAQHSPHLQGWERRLLREVVGYHRHRLAVLYPGCKVVMMQVVLRGVPG